MTFLFRSLVQQASSHLARDLKEQISSLCALIPIESAEVVLERRRYPNGPFRLRAYLAVPGPNLSAVSSGYTVPEVILKLKKNLLSQIKSRRTRRRDTVGLSLRRPPALPK